LKILSYLITPAIVPDKKKRQLLLGASDSGAMLRFDFFELFSSTYQQSVSCSSSKYDFIDARVLASVFEALGRQQPMRLPADKITDMVKTMLGIAPSLTGIAIGSDLDLKIGLLLDRGTPHGFDSQATFSHFPKDDWGVTLDTSFVTAAITEKLNAEVKKNPDATADSISVKYVKAQYSSGPVMEIDVTVKGTLHKCQDPFSGAWIPFTIDVAVQPVFRRLPSGESLLTMPYTQTTSNGANAWQVACGVLDAIGKFFGTLVSSLTGGGMATLEINNAGVCKFRMSEVGFDVGPSDHFYGVDVDTDGVFYIAGRSTFMDRILGSRGSVPAC
jgi:hypothetical protein